MQKKHENTLTEAHNLFHYPARFVTSSPDLHHLPETLLPEIAFAGRSNCGKSSLLNTLMGTKTLARTSNTPGRTKLLNFFTIGDVLMLVDLPGYGFAKASQADRNLWQRNWEGYIQGRFPLCHVFLLIDTRRGVMDIDQRVMSGLDAAKISYSLVLTKADKLPENLVQEVHDRTCDILADFSTEHKEPIDCSVKKRRGIDRIQQMIATIVNAQKDATFTQFQSVVTRREGI